MSPVANPHHPGAEPALSVIMAVRDVADRLADAVRSVLDQSFADLELIIIDDASTDETRDVIASFTDPRLSVHAATGRGGAAARNEGVARARGEFLAFADGDDLVPGHAYGCLVEQARRTGAEMVVGNYVTFTPSTAWSRQSTLPLYGEVRHGVSLRDTPDFIRDRVHWNRIVRRSVWQRLSFEFADSQHSEDTRVVTDTYCFLYFDVIPDVVYARRERVGRSSTTAARSAPSPLAEHLRQELAISAAVRRYGDEEVTRVCFDDVLTHDLWHRLAPVLIPGRLCEDRYAEVRELVGELLQAAPAEAIAGLGPLHRMTYGLIRAGIWDLAAVPAQLDVSDLRALLAEHGAGALVAATRAHVPDPDEALDGLLRSAYLTPLREASWGADLSDTQMMSLISGARELAAAGAPGHLVDTREAIALAAPVSEGAEAVRRHLSEAAVAPEAAPASVADSAPTGLPTEPRPSSARIKGLLRMPTQRR